MKAKKSYGQHFLNQPAIAEQIAKSLILTDTYENVLEVGPGTGNLTRFLLEEDFNLKVVEADRDMVFALASKYPAIMEGIIREDFLKVDLKKMFDGKSFGLIGNFPYNISSQILFKMVENKELIPEMVGMFQKEVADRVVSKEGNKTYGVVSVLIQAFYDGESLFDVDKSCFSPPPKVQSAVIRLVRKENQDLGCDYKLFRQVVKQTFSQRRKMLRNTIKSFLPEGFPIMENKSLQRRPEQLSVADFVELTQFIAENRE